MSTSSSVYVVNLGHLGEFLITKSHLIEEYGQGLASAYKVEEVIIGAGLMSEPGKTIHSAHAFSSEQKALSFVREELEKNGDELLEYYRKEIYRIRNELYETSIKRDKLRRKINRARSSLGMPLLEV